MIKKYDCIIIGGGLAGTSAAISAARNGMKTLIVEKHNCLGGTATAGLVEPFMPVSTKINGSKTLLCQGVFLEIVKNLLAEQPEKNPEEYYTWDTTLDDEYLKLLLNRMVMESGAEILFHSCLTDVEVKDSRIVSVTVFGVSGKMKLCADYFIDASGDAQLSCLSGVPFRLGREGDHLCQPMTLCFRLSNVDVSLYKKNRAKMDELYTKFQQEGKIKNPQTSIQIFDNCVSGVLHFNSARVIKHNPTDAFELSHAEIEGRELVYELYRFLKENVAGFENARIIKTGFSIGVRESRMIDGEYILTGEDLVDCKKFPDAVVLANYDLDLHDPVGGGTSHHYFEEGTYYTIPYRSLIPLKIENLLVAGKCISVTHEAQASIRVMPIVCALGQVAGTAIGIAKKNHCLLKNIDVPKLQKTLIEQGAYLKTE